MLIGEEDLAGTGEYRQVTLYCRSQDFTALSEKKYREELPTAPLDLVNYDLGF